MVDFIDLDIQGSEFTVLAVAIIDLCEKVKRIHIGTHGKDIEDRLRDLFVSAGWINIFDFSTGSTVDTDFGLVTFGDGVQSWVNPEFVKEIQTSSNISKYQKILNAKSKFNEAALEAKKAAGQVTP